MNKNRVFKFSKITAGALALAIGNYFFNFPNKFVFGGVTGIALLLGEVTPWSTGTINLIINIFFLLLGVAFFGKQFGIITTYVALLSSTVISLLEVVCPISSPLTTQPVLEFAFSILFTGVGTAILFNCEASSGGTDIIAMILKKYTGANIGTMLLVSNVVITLCSFFVFSMEAALFSIMGLIIKSIIIDNTIDNLNRFKYLMIICDETEPICEFIIKEIKKSATVCEAKGAFSHSNKYIIISVMRGKQVLLLRKFIKEQEPSAFILVSNSSEIFGKGFLKIH